MRALVFSAGGMFGAWQAGAWSVLEEVYRPELVVGASVGALHAWAVGSGIPARELIQYWRQLGPLSLWPAHRQQEARQSVEKICHRLAEQCRPVVPVGIVCTEWPRLRPRLFRGQHLGWQHLAASCAIPLLMPPYRIEGRSYCDGGLLNALPLWAALEMGATAILAIHVLPILPWPMRIPLRMLRWLAGGNRKSGLGRVPALLIGPTQRLGSWRQAMVWDKANVERWVALGQAIARQHLGRASQLGAAVGPS